MRTIAALFVDPAGIYSTMPDVDCWGIERDARLYAGPHPVVSHPPCQRWGPLAPQVEWRFPGREDRKVGADAGCFAAALAAVRRWGGVLEHPAKSLAWAAHGLMVPDCRQSGGWSVADDVGGWTCQVEQRHYGHRARKATWLYAVGCDLPSLRWGAGPPGVRVAGDGYHSKEERLRKQADRYANGRPKCKPGDVQMMGKKEREATPPAFAEMLVAMARSVRGRS